MDDGRIRMLLRQADEIAGKPAFGRISAAGMHQRIRRRRIVTILVPVASAAIVVLGTTLWIVCTRAEAPRTEPERIASLEGQVRQLKTQTDATLRLVQEVLERDRQERHLAALEAELVSIGDPVQEIERQVDKTAFVMVYQADRLYEELNQAESAVEAYKEVIQLFPDNRWADVARERLSQIEKRQINKSDRKGVAKCGLQRV